MQFLSSRSWEAARCSVEGPHHDISLMSHLVCGFDPSARGKAVNLHSVKQLELSLPSALSFARTEANKKQQLTRQPISCVDLSTTNTATSTAAVVNWVAGQEGGSGFYALLCHAYVPHFHMCFCLQVSISHLTTNESLCSTGWPITSN